MLRAARPWLVVLPLSCAGVLAGHELAYAVTGTQHDELHGYLTHVPQVALLVTLLSLLGAACVERGSRIALWPFPAVAMSGFVVQEHLERIAHTGAIPNLLLEPVFLVGLVVQGIVALAAWLVARLLVRAVGRPAGRGAPRPRLELPRRQMAAALVTGLFAPCGLRLRAPPLGR